MGRDSCEALARGTRLQSTIVTRSLPYVVLLAISFPLWSCGRWLSGEALFQHNRIDQHTRQARAWLSGRFDLRPPDDGLEIAHYRGRSYNSFPPTPSLVELPLVMIFGRRTPSGMAVFGFLYLTLTAQFAALRRRGFATRSAMMAALAFLFGTNVYPSCALANVWGYGQALGYALATTGLCLVMHNARTGLRGPATGYVLLSLAVGCRPPLLLLMPLMIAVDRETNGLEWFPLLRRAALCMSPYGSALGLYNWVRFDDPLEFGHSHLPWAQSLSHGIFSIHYLPWNVYHAFFRLPEVAAEPPLLRFDTLGTAFWLNNGVLLLATLALVRSGSLAPAVRLAGCASLLGILACVLTYESSNNVQFGARYFIDLLPGAFAILALTYRSFDRLALALSGVSFSVNLYGLAAWPSLR